MSAATNLHAQATLFHDSGLTKANLTTTDATKYEYFEYSSKTEGLWLMHLSNFSSQVSNGYLKLKVPGNDTLRRYKARYVQTKPNGNILWYGDLVDDYGQETNGYATLTCYGGKVIGDFSLNDQAYALYPIRDSLYLFVKEDTDIAYTCGYQSPGGETQLTGDEETTDGGVQDRSCSSNEVKVMVLYTPAAADISFFGVNIEQGIDGLIAQANNALRNSGISSSQLWFSLAYKGLLSGFTETSLINTDLNSFSTNSTVNSLRDANAADCVVLLTVGDYGNFLGLTVGLDDNCSISDDQAFSIVQIGSGITFTHELGHQFGCKHSFGSPTNGACEPDYEQPREFKYRGRRLNTLMEAGVSHRIPHFSNPDVIYHGNATGTAKQNNARQLREKAAEVAAYRNPITPSLTIDGPDDLCIRTGLNPIGTFTANICGWENTTYTLAWQISVNDGTAYGTALSTSSTLSLNALSFSLDDVIFIRLTLTDATGAQTFAFAQPVVSTCGGHEPPRGLVVPYKGTETLKLSPNPAMGQVTGSLQILEASPVTITLLSASGTKIRMLEQKSMEEGEANFTWELGDLPTGIYQIQTATTHSREVQKLTIFH